jgi:hypothetical protein
VPVVDVVLVLATQARQPLHQLLGIPDLDLFRADPRLDLFANQARGHRIGVVLDPDGAATPHPHPQPFQRLQTFPRQRLQVRPLQRQRRGPTRIALLLYLTQQLRVRLAAAKVPAAS